MDQEAAYENRKRNEGSQPESDERQTCDGDGALAPQSVRVVFRGFQFIKPEIRALFLEYGNRVGRALIALHKPPAKALIYAIRKDPTHVLKALAA